MHGLPTCSLWVLGRLPVFALVLATACGSAPLRGGVASPPSTADGTLAIDGATPSDSPSEPTSESSLQAWLASRAPRAAAGPVELVPDTGREDVWHDETGSIGGHLATDFAMPWRALAAVEPRLAEPSTVDGRAPTPDTLRLSAVETTGDGDADAVFEAVWLPHAPSQPDGTVIRALCQVSDGVAVACERLGEPQVFVDEPPIAIALSAVDVDADGALELVLLISEPLGSGELSITELRLELWSTRLAGAARSERLAVLELGADEPAPASWGDLLAVSDDSQWTLLVQRNDVDADGAVESVLEVWRWSGDGLARVDALGAVVVGASQPLADAVAEAGELATALDVDATVATRPLTNSATALVVLGPVEQPEVLARRVGAVRDVVWPLRGALRLTALWDGLAADEVLGSGFAGSTLAAPAEPEVRSETDDADRSPRRDARWRDPFVPRTRLRR